MDNVNCEPEREPVRIIQPYRVTASDRAFRKRIRAERGNKCERCGASGADTDIHCHHVLEVQTYPEFAKETANVVVVCQECHKFITTATHAEVWEHDFRAARIQDFYAGFPVEVRQRIGGFLAKHAPHLSGIIKLCG